MAQHTGGSDWINAYLEWTDGEIGISGQLFAVSGMAAGDDWAEEIASVYLEWIDAAPKATQREAVLLMALRTESEFMHILRQALEDETRMDWPCALENVEADVRALSGRILELRAH